MLEETLAQEFVLEEMAEQMMNVQAPSAQTGFYDLTGQGGLPGVNEAPAQTEVDRNAAEPEPEGSVPTPGVSPHREAQPQVEEDVELPTVQFDVDVPQFDADSPLLPMEAEHVPMPRTTTC